MGGGAAQIAPLGDGRDGLRWGPLVEGISQGDVARMLAEAAAPCNREPFSSFASGATRDRIGPAARALGRSSMEGM